MRAVVHLIILANFAFVQGFISPLPSAALSQHRGVSQHIIGTHSKPSSSRSSFSLIQLMANNHENNDYDVKQNIPLKQKRKHHTPSISIALGLTAFIANTGIAHAKKTVTAATTTTASTLILPSIPTLILACTLPTLLGYYKSEYGVSYGYGTAIATSSYLILSSLATAAGSPLTLPTILPTIKSLLTSNSLPAFHAISLLFYGTRLNLFLLYREICLPRFRAMRERIEDRAKKQGSRWKRTPFLLSCAFLYFGMICPLLVTSSLTNAEVFMCNTGGVMEKLIKGLVVATFSGFMLGAVGDLNKNVGKLIQGEDALITGGVFRFFRHPNYTGEVIGWVSSCLAAFVAVAWKSSKTGGLAVWKSQAPYLSMSVLGAIGISFVLGTATAGLEYRQKEKYGDLQEYKDWVQRSWVGFTMGQKRKETSDDSQRSSEAEEKKEEE